MKLKKIFPSETAEPNYTKPGRDGPWVGPFQNCVRQPHPPFKMAAVQPSWMEGGAVGHKFERDPPKDHPCQV
jgi:hypothetical protein